MSNFYSGTRLLEPLATWCHLGVDQMNFLLCQVVAIGLGRFFQNVMGAPKCSAVQRHLFELVVGVGLILFCFGFQLWHLLVQSVLVFGVLHLVPGSMGRYAVLIFSLGYLSMAHIFRVYFDYGGYTLDITGPLMIQTQRLSSLAFNLYDGEKLNQGEKLTERHKLHAIRRMPSVLEFFSYMLSFHGVILGPFVFMADYIRFIEGREVDGLSAEEDKRRFTENRTSILQANHELRFHLLSCMFHGGIMMFFIQQFPSKYFISDEFVNSSLPYKAIYLTVACFVIRNKYYFAWSTGSAANISAGIGFIGFDSETRKAKYDIVKNFYFDKIELGTSMKMMIDGWNTGTTSWLRECVYDRVPRSISTACVFLCSALWHGFYPGYYLCFMTAALFTGVARVCRRFLRPIFHAYSLAGPYNVLTALASMFALNYCAISFQLLECSTTIQFWKTIYFIGHVVAFFLYVGSPYLARALRVVPVDSHAAKQTSNSASEQNTVSSSSDAGYANASENAKKR